MWIKHRILILTALLCTFATYVNSEDNDDSNPFMDIAASFLQETLVNQNGGGAGANSLAGIASLIGNLVQPDGGSKSNNGGGLDAAQIIGGIGTLMAAANGGNNGGQSGGFDPAIIGNVIEMFTSGGDEGKQGRRQKRSGQENPGLDTLLNLASAFMGNSNQVKGQPSGAEGLLSLLPMVVQAVNSFSGEEGGKVHARHKDHAWVLPPFLEKIHVMWDHFSNSELAEAMWKKSGIDAIFKGFTGRDGKLDYDKLFGALNNQGFRRRWIKSATLYLSDWANYIAEPEVYKRYIATAQVMINGFLQSQGIPKHALFDPQRPSESIATLVDFIALHYMQTKFSSLTYVKPAVSYARDLLKLGKARGVLQKFNATELSDKLTDTVNLEVIEPILRIHRAYRFTKNSPKCDKFVLCEVNSHNPNEKLELAGFKSGITKFGSMAAAWFIGAETGTPFWTLYSVINEPTNCAKKYPGNCAGFQEGEAVVTTEYIHNEL